MERIDEFTDRVLQDGCAGFKNDRRCCQIPEYLWWDYGELVGALCKTHADEVIEAESEDTRE